MWRLERRLKEGYRSNQSTWSLGNTTWRLRLCVLMRVALYQSSCCRPELARELSLDSPNISNHLIWWFWTLSPSVKRRNICALTQFVHLRGSFMSGHRMLPGSPSALETRRSLGRGVDVGQSAQPCSSWRMHTPQSTGYPRHPSHLGLCLGQHVGLPSPHGLHWEAIPRRLLSPKLPGHLLLAPYNWPVRKHHLIPQPQTVYFSLDCKDIYNFSLQIHVLLNTWLLIIGKYNAAF